MMPAGSVHMAVLDFFGAGLADFDDLHGEMQGFACERMIAVDGYLVAFDLGDHDGDRALACLRLELHADSEVGDAVEGATWNDLHEFVDVAAIPVFSGDIDVETVACHMSGHLALEAGNDIARTVQIGQRLAAFGTVDDLARIVGQGVVKGRNAALGNLHVSLVDSCGKKRPRALTPGVDGVGRQTISRRERLRPADPSDPGSR